MLMLIILKHKDALLTFKFELWASAIGQTNRYLVKPRFWLVWALTAKVFTKVPKPLQMCIKIFPCLTVLSVRPDVWGSSERHLRSLGSDLDSLENCISQNGSSTNVIQENLAVILPDQGVMHFDPHLRMELVIFARCDFSFFADASL